MGQAILVPLALAAVGSAVGAGAAALLAPHNTPPQAVKPTPPPMIDEAAGLASQDAQFRQRRGAAANMVTGSSGAEAPSPGVKSLLGQ